MLHSKRKSACLAHEFPKNCVMTKPNSCASLNFESNVLESFQSPHNVVLTCFSGWNRLGHDTWRKSSVEECILDNVTLHSECHFNQNSLLRCEYFCFFLVFLANYLCPLSSSPSFDCFASHLYTIQCKKSESLYLQMRSVPASMWR